MNYKIANVFLNYTPCQNWNMKNVSVEFRENRKNIDLDHSF